MNSMDLIYLMACAINGIVPDAGRISDITADMDSLFKFASFHQVTALTACALSSAGVRDAHFMQDLAVTTWKDMVMAEQLEKIEAAFDEAGIWHMRLKGAILKDYYPQPYQRQMSDVDILIDPAAEDKTDELMASLGFERKKDPDHEFDNHGMYEKKPVSCFEIHWKLIGKNTLFKKGYQYYKDVEDKLVADDENRFVRHFSDEDFYLFMIAHEYKHYNFGGVGIRSLIDTYVFLKKFRKSLDWKYIEREAEKLGIADFEKMNRKLSVKLFAPGSFVLSPGEGMTGDAAAGENAVSLTEEEAQMLTYFVSSGTYGVKTHVAANRVKNIGWGRFLLGEIFLPMKVVKTKYPFFYKHKVLLPALPIYHMVSKRKKILNMVRELKKEKSIPKRDA